MGRPLDLFSLLRRWKPVERTGLDGIKSSLALLAPTDTEDWELDVAEIPSQNAAQAWRTYGALLEETEERYRCVVYGRFVDGPTLALQYWYLYMYSDFVNRHEGDWQMVTIELGQDRIPVRIGLSGHFGGLLRMWERVCKVDERPLVYVARGSHAGYFEYRPRGYAVLNLVVRSNLPPGLRLLVSALRGLPSIRRWRDLPPADPELDAGTDPKDIGVRVSPELHVLPDDIDQPPDAPWWWLRYRGNWGSNRPRLAGSAGIGSPWTYPVEDPRWGDPVRWLAMGRPLTMLPSTGEGGASISI